MRPLNMTRTPLRPCILMSSSDVMIPGMLPSKSNKSVLPFLSCTASTMYCPALRVIIFSFTTTYYKLIESAICLSLSFFSWAETPAESNNSNIDMHANFLMRRCCFVGHFACKCMKKRTNNTLLSVYKTVYKCSQSSQTVYMGIHLFHKKFTTSHPLQL